MSKSRHFSHPPACHSDGRGGFTLVEVTLALGIISFAIVVILAMMMNGLNIVRSANIEGTASVIASSVSSHLRGGVNLPVSAEPEPFFFDHHGSESSSGEVVPGGYVVTARHLPPSGGGSSLGNAYLVEVFLSEIWTSDTPRKTPVYISRLSSLR